MEIPKLKIRDRESHKGTYGSAYLFAGCQGMMGAALLSARACMRSGLGLLTVHTPSCGYQIMQVGIPEAKCDADTCKTHITQMEVPANISAIGVGPGIGRNVETEGALHRLFVNEYEAEMKGVNHPMVIDADGLNILAAHPEWISLLPKGTILTPHPGEWKRFGQNINIPNDRIIVVLKGTYTKVYCNTGEVWTNTEHGNSGMAVGGSGDTLTGIILSLLAQGYDQNEAAKLGVYVHSYAADIALTKESEESLLPSDIIDSLGETFKRMRLEGEV